ncbi:hemicentin-1-like [Galleria mellonella]|uniref:Hemicentin-1-like n=1 Tax=Galleria mellonella TaxID=7137 RepID=A0A6J1WDD0_GALME|nr:hemicentin-1-like [Galleria mellonella]
MFFKSTNKFVSFIFLLNIFLLVQAQSEKSSVTFIIDDTGSMSDDIQQVKREVHTVFNTVMNSAASQIENFILITFNDPGVKLLTITKDKDEFKNYLESIDVNGGGDCPEYAMSGIELGLEKSLPGSYFYVFTDASAKDYEKLKRIQSLAIKKQTQVVFLLTGRCNYNDDDPMYKSYHTLAAATSGRVFHMNKSEVGEIIKYIADTVESRKTKIVAKKFAPGYGHKVEYTLDSETNGSSVIISGEDPKGKVTNPDGSISSVPTIDTSGVVVIKPPSLTGTYIAEVGSKSETSVVVMATTKIDFQHGFSVFKPKLLNATTIKPIADIKSYLSIALITDSENVELKKISIVDLDDKIILEKPVELIDKKTNYYITEPFVPPNSLFKIGITVYNPKTNSTIKRFSLTPIEPQKPELDGKPIDTSPVVTILDGSELNAEYDEPLKLVCKVHGYPKPDIVWENAISSEVLKSELTVLEPPYDYISTLEIDKVNNNVTYRCKAFIKSNEDSKTIDIKTKRKYYFEMLEIPKDLNIEYKKEGSVHCKVNAYPPATTVWYAKGKRIYGDSKNVLISADSTILTIKHMEPHLQGAYMCEVRNEFERNVTNFKISITGLEAPVIRKGVNKINVLKGKSIEISCRIVRGIPKPKFSWMLRKHSETYSLSEDTESLYLNNVTSEHNGVYRCLAVNVVGVDYHDTEVIVNYPPQIKNDKTVIQAVEGSKPILLCNTDGAPAPYVRWFLNGTLLRTDTDHQIYRDNSMRIIASEENSGKYTCVAENIYGKAERTVQVDYIVPVNIELPDRSTLETRVGRHLVLPCRADGYPKPDVKWVFYSTNPEIPPKILKGEKGTLTLKAAQQEHSGFYTCIASNPGSSVNITYEVKVHAPPVILNTHPDRIYTAVVEDLALRVPCHATGNPEPEITWHLNRLPVPKGEWFDIEEDGTLVIKNPDSNSGGFYYCKAQNKFGIDQKYFHVVVKQVPDASTPTSSIVIKEGNTVHIKCDVPHEKIDKLRWFKNNKLIRTGELILNNARAADTGVYICRVSNFVESASATTKVTVGLVPRFKVNEENTNINYEEGTVIDLNCVTEGEPTPQVSWWHDGIILDETESTYYLEMEDDSSIGQYTCVVSNEIGSINRTFTVALTDCLLNIERDFEGNQPLMVTNDLRLPSYKIINNEAVRVPKDEVIILSCPERFNLLPLSEVQATCISETDFNIGGRIYKYSDLKCTTPTQPVIRNTGLHCAGPRTESVKVGYSIRGRFLEVYEVCLSKEKGVPLYTKNFIHWTLADVEPKDAKWINHESAPYDFDALYDCRNQITTISFTLGEKFHYDDGCCFAKRQLVSSKDLYPGLPQVTAFNHLNVIPLWSTCGSRNWDEVEERVRTLANSTHNELLVWTGTSKHLELPNVVSDNIAININDNTKEQPIPQYIWKVVQNPPTRQSLAIIKVNIPDMDPRDAYKHMLCTDICENISWMRNKAWKDTTKGFVYCCKIRDFERAFGFNNYFSPSGNRILDAVSIISDHSLILV